MQTSKVEIETLPILGHPILENITNSVQLKLKPSLNALFTTDLFAWARRVCSLKCRHTVSDRHRTPSWLVKMGYNTALETSLPEVTMSSQVESNSEDFCYI